MKKIEKYTFADASVGTQGHVEEFDMPVGATFVHFGMSIGQPEVNEEGEQVGVIGRGPSMYVMVDVPDDGSEPETLKRRFLLTGSRRPIPNFAHYCGTIVYGGTWHVLEIVEN